MRSGTRSRRIFCVTAGTCARCRNCSGMRRCRRRRNTPRSKARGFLRSTTPRIRVRGPSDPTHPPKCPPPELPRAMRYGSSTSPRGGGEFENCARGTGCESVSKPMTIEPDVAAREDAGEKKDLPLGYAFAAAGALLFSTKGIIVKLAYGYDVSPETLIALRAAFSLPFYLAIGAFAWINL